MQKAKTGFTLLELMVSVGLMLILVTSVVTVFNHTSSVFTIFEAKMSIYQNATAVFDTMERELASAENSSIGDVPEFKGFFYSHNDSILKFKTSTYWIKNGVRQSGMAIVEYYLQDVPGHPVCNLMKRVSRIDMEKTPVVEEVSNAILGQYVNKSVRNKKDVYAFHVKFFEYNVDTKIWEMKPKNKTKEDDDDWEDDYFIKSKEPLPHAARITINFTDKENRIIRTLSRTVWILKASS